MKKLNILRKAGPALASLLMMLVIASPALAQDTTNVNTTDDAYFPAWDADQNGNLSEDEFNAGISETGYYNGWDVDGNGTLTEEEWNSGMEENMSDYNSEYPAWDEDGDGEITEDEFYRGTYNTLDENRDEAIDGYEWGNWFDNGIF